MILEVVRHSRNLIGADLANSAFHGDVFDLRGNLIQRIDLPVRDKNGMQALELVTQLIDTLLESCNGPVLEIGHVRVVKQGTLCLCGQRGSAVSSRALIKKAKVLFQDNRNSTLQQPVTSSEEITIDIVLQAFRAGNEAIRLMIIEVGQFLGIAVAHLVGALNIQHIFIAGSVARFGETLLDSIRSEVLQRTMSILADNNRSVFSQLGQDIVMLGAASHLLTNELGLT